MPYLIINDTHEIFKISELPLGVWENVHIECKRLINWHHDIEWEYAPAFGIKNMKTKDVIVQTRDMAYDVEYYYRGAEEIAHTPGVPNSVTFS